MRRLCSGIVVMGLLASAPLFAQQRELSPERKADTEALRGIAKATPALPGQIVDVKVDRELTGPSAAAADKNGNIYVLHRPAEAKPPQDGDPVMVFDAKGNFLRSFGKGMYTIPHGIKVDPAGNVWTIDSSTSLVLKFSPEGKNLMKVDVGGIPDPKRAFCGATDVAFAKDGRFFISDGYCNSRVIEYTADGKKVKEWGSRGTGRGQFMNVHAISLADDGTLYVADRENGRVQWFDQSGNYLGEKKFGGQLFSVVAAPDGGVYVGTQPRDVEFATDPFLFKFDPKSGKIIGKVDMPAHQLSLGPNGALYPGTRRRGIQIFQPK
ncbi:MAG: peptidyl-alpha-hydroxyglycine alpha-amidating lyase family protein [Rhodospirillaceae bacterium]